MKNESTKTVKTGQRLESQSRQSPESRRAYFSFLASI